MAWVQYQEFAQLRREVAQLRQQVESLPVASSELPGNLVEVELVEKLDKTRLATLIKNGYLTVASLRAATDQQLLDLQDIGEAGLNKIRAFAPFEETNAD